MIIEAQDLPKDQPLKGDIIIVGAGPVGLLLAKRLRQNGSSCILLEAGPKVATVAEGPFHISNLGQPHNGVELGRAIGLGGTSCLWGGQLAEFRSEDLSRPGYEWPICFNELQKYYNHVYHLLGLGDGATIEEYQNEFGINLTNHEEIEQFFTYWLPQPNFGTLLEKEIKNDPDFIVVTNACVNGINFQGSKACTITYCDSFGQHFSAEAKNFVFAAGTLANIQFFLTTARYGNVPWAKNDGIGQYFHDHLGANVAEVIVHDEVKFRRSFENGFALGRKLQPKLRFRPSGQSRGEISVCGYFAFRSSAAAHMTNIKFVLKSLRSGVAYSNLLSLPQSLVGVSKSLAPLIVKYVKDRRIMAMFDAGIDFLVQAEQVPIARSQVVVVDMKPNQYGLLPVGLDWQIHGCEVAVISRFVREVDSFLRKSGIAALKYDARVWEDPGIIKSLFTDTYHQCGGLRMSAERTSGVTDSDARVWGTSNVYIAGSAIMPTSSYANCTLTALALAVRLADKLSKHHQSVSI